MAGNKKEATPVSLGAKVVGEIELPTLDLSGYVGRKVKIASVQEYEGQYGHYVKMTTEVVATIDEIKDENGKPLQLKGSRIFGLQHDAEGRIGWGKDTKLGLYLKKKGVKHYRDLTGKEVVAQIRVDDEGREFLTFE